VMAIIILFLKKAVYHVCSIAQFVIMHQPAHNVKLDSIIIWNLNHVSSNALKENNILILLNNNVLIAILLVQYVIILVILVKLATLVKLKIHLGFA